MRAVVGVVVVVAACYHPTVATDVPCSSKGECPEGQLCDTGRTPPTCVAAIGDARPVDIMADTPVDAPPQCTSNAECAAGAPVCDLASHTCRGCTADADCALISGGACTEYDGQCVADTDTIYVSTTGVDLGACTSGAPCGTVGFALTQVTATRRTIAIGDGTYPVSSGSPAINITDTAGRIVISGLRLDYSGGAVVSAMTNGTTNPQVVTTSGGTDVVLEGFSVVNGGQDGIRSNGALLISHVAVTGNAGRGLNLQPQSQAPTHVWSSRIAGSGNEGIFMSNSGPLEILRSQILQNMNGGISMRQGAFTMISTIVAHNGGNASQFGGVQLQNLGGIAPRLEFDTIANNNSKNTTASPGLAGDNSAAIAIASSITCNNTANNVTNPTQICASCTATYTLFSGTPPIGTGNVVGAPGFVSVAADDFHITSASGARNGGDPNATIHYDVDGETRPQGMFDMGADEIP